MEQPPLRSRRALPSIGLAAATCALTLIAISQWAFSSGGLFDILRPYGRVGQSLEWVLLSVAAIGFGSQFDRTRRWTQSALASGTGVAVALAFVVGRVGFDPWNVRTAGTFYALPLLLTAALLCGASIAAGVRKGSPPPRSASLAMLAGLTLQAVTWTILLALPLSDGPPPLEPWHAWASLVGTLAGFVLPSAIYTLALVRAVRAQRMLGAWLALLLIAPAAGLAALQLSTRLG